MALDQKTYRRLKQAGFSTRTAREQAERGFSFDTPDICTKCGMQEHGQVDLCPAECSPTT